MASNFIRLNGIIINKNSIKKIGAFFNDYGYTMDIYGDGNKKYFIGACIKITLSGDKQDFIYEKIELEVDFKEKDKVKADVLEKINKSMENLEKALNVSYVN